MRELEAEDPLVRGTAVVTLLRLPAEELLASLEAAEWQGARALAGLAAAAGADRLDPGVAARVRELLSASEEFTRSRAARLAVVHSLVDEAGLERLGEDPSWVVRARLAAALRERKGASSVLETLSKDPHPTVRRAARRAAGRDEMAALSPERGV